MEKSISFVIPVFNEEKNIPDLYSEIRSLIDKNLKSYSVEVIFINDGSTDTSLDTLKNLALKEKEVKIISFRRNMGKAAALNEGFKKASGEVVVTLDADLQDHPSNLPLLLEELEKGSDLVVGWRKKRSDTRIKILSSRLFNTTASFISHVPLHDINSGFKVMKYYVAKDLNLYGEQHRVIPVVVASLGYRVSEVAVSHYPRKFGKSKYGKFGLARSFKGVFDLLTVLFLGTYAERPFHLFGLLGLFSMFLGVSMGVYLSLLHFQGVSISRRPLLTLAVLLILAGLQLICFGLLSEMIVAKSTIHTEPPIDYQSANLPIG